MAAGVLLRVRRRPSEAPRDQGAGGVAADRRLRLGEEVRQADRADPRCEGWRGGSPGRSGRRCPGRADARPGRARRAGYGVLLWPPPLLFLVPATVETYLATDWIWALDSELPKAGIPPPPLVTWWTTSASDGLSWSRLGPTVPVEPAAASVWQEAQVLSNTFIPALRLTAVEELLELDELLVDAPLVEL